MYKKAILIGSAFIGVYSSAYTASQGAPLRASAFKCTSTITYNQDALKQLSTADQARYKSLQQGLEKAKTAMQSSAYKALQSQMKNLNQQMGQLQSQLVPVYNKTAPSNLQINTQGPNTFDAENAFSSWLNAQPQMISLNKQIQTAQQQGISYWKPIYELFNFENNHHLITVCTNCPGKRMDFVQLYALPTQ